MDPDTTLHAWFQRSEPALRADGWTRRELDAGERLWSHEEAATSLAWVDAGLVRVELDGIERGRVGAGELLGEASAFIPEQRRSADVIALEPTRLWVLHQTRLSHLRGNNVEFYDRILRSAVATIARRIGDNDRELSRRRRADHGLPAWTPPTLWTRVRRTFERPGPPPPAVDAIAALPNIPAAGLLASDIAAIAEPLWLKTAEALCLEGDPARSMYVIADGTLTVMLSSGGQAIELDRVGPGALLGTAALLHDSVRGASLVAAEPTWVYELARERVDTLSAGARRLLVESLVVVMREQLVRTNARAGG